MDDQATTQEQSAHPVDTEAQKAAKELRRLEYNKAFVDGVKFMLLTQKREVEANIRAAGIHYGEPCSDKEVGYDSSHNYHDLGDPCYCGSDNCGICLDCGEENHD